MPRTFEELDGTGSAFADVIELRRIRALATTGEPLKTPTLFFALVLAVASPSNAAVIYGPTQIGSSARTSDYGSAAQFGFRTFDNFATSINSTVETLTWFGFWADFDSPIPTAAPAPDVQNWEIAFYADNGGSPGTQLSFESFAAGAVTSTFLGNGLFTTNDTYNVAIYRYSVALTNPFSVSGGTDYWFSVMSRSSAYYPAFVLFGATGGDDASFQQTLGAGLSVLAENAVSRDRAVVLEGTVPEPPATILLAMAALLLPLSRRLRRA